MVKRFGRKCSYKTPVLSSVVIEERIEKCKLTHLCPDEIADHLYSAFPDYNHYKLIPFRSKIRQILQQQSRKRKRDCAISDEKYSVLRSSVSANSFSMSSHNDSDSEAMLNAMLREGYKENLKFTKNSKDCANTKDSGELCSKIVEEERGDNKKDLQKGVGPSFRDFGGIKNLLEDLECDVVQPLRHPKLMRLINVKPI